MILPFSALALAAQAAALPPAAAATSDDVQFARCARLVQTDSARGAAAADDWRLKGGGLSARHCLGLAYVAQERWAPAATVFEQAATGAEAARDARLADFWVQAGNAWLAADEPAKARAALDRALVAGIAAAELRGEVLLDRARADVALGELAAARIDIDKATALVPADPLAWHLSSALAVREKNYPLARAHADKALERAPDAPEILLQAGTATALAGDEAAARALYARAARAGPQSEAGRAAAAALAGGAEAATPASPPAPDGQSR